MKNALIIFVRNPVLGKVKTRLAQTMGDEEALKVYKALLLKTHETVQEINCDKYIFYHDNIGHNDSWPASIYKKELQVTGTLGEKMTAAARQIFDKGYEKLLIIGSDCYALTAAIIETAFAQLSNVDVVIGPATDGGYYLIGQSRFIPALFALKEWSTPQVLQDTLAICSANSIPVYQLPMLSDVDEEKDIDFEY